MAKKVKTSKGKEVMRDLAKENTISLSKGIKLLVILVIILVAFYFVAAITTGEIELKKKDNNPTIQYEKILAGSTFKQRDKEYIVVYYDFDSKDNESVSTTIDSYKAVSTSKSLYTVNLAEKINKEYQTDKNSNKKPKNAKELKIKGTTLILIKDGKVMTYIEGNDKVKDYLK